VSAVRKVIVVGLDGLEPTIVDRLLAAGALPNLARLRSAGGYSRVATTTPAQTPVAWSTFATGVNPGGHGIFDFIRRDPATYLPDLALNRYQQKSAFLPPKAVNLRRGTPVWELLTKAGIPSVVIRCPCTYPPDTLKGRLLSGMGVPDLRGGLGTSTFYTTQAGVRTEESETVIGVTVSGGAVRTHLVGPRNPKGGDATLDIRVEIEAAQRKVVIHSEGTPKALDVPLGRWSDWLKVKFKLGMLQLVHGMVRFHLVRLEPFFELHASPLNFDPETPVFPISHPWDYAQELQRAIGTYYTTGMVEDHGGLNNGRFDEAAYLDHCDGVMREREAMLGFELDRMRDGLLFCLFDTPDRLQHMMWRFREPGHPANRGAADPRYARAIEEHYQGCDAVVGRVLQRADDRTLVIVLSDHGFSSFQRGVHLNSWLHANGFLALAPDAAPGDGAQFLRGVDWSRTTAYALGLGSVYLNLAGREAGGIVRPDQAAGLGAAIAAGLTGLTDPARGQVAIRRVARREDVYAGPCVGDAPDLVVLFNEGYRVSWDTALGGVPAGLIEDNVKRWGGDHIIDPALVPGVLFMSAPFRAEGARLLDLAPTILSAFGVPNGEVMEGESLLT
jgi:predicted AlkP superfamily phosphohydrolase/phosphomutase